APRLLFALLLPDIFCGCPTTTHDASVCVGCVSIYSAGSFSANSSATECVPCESGKYAAAGHSACTDCVAGTYTNHSGSILCARCAVNSFTSRGGLTECTPCPKSQFQKFDGEVIIVVFVCLACEF